METKKLLLTKEAAGILRISEEYLRSLIRNKKIAAYEARRAKARSFHSSGRNPAPSIRAF